MFGLFGKPRRSLADIQQATAQPYNDRIDAAGGQATYAQVPQVMPEKPKGEGGRRIAGILGDFLLGLGGQQGVYGPMMQQQRLLDRRSQQQAQQAEAERMARREEFTFEHDYKRANPEPRVNDTVADYEFLTQRLGKEGADQYLRNMADPMVTVPLGDGTFYNGPRSGLGAAFGGGQQEQGPKPPRLGPVVDQIPGGPAPAPGGFPR